MRPPLMPPSGRFNAWTTSVGTMRSTYPKLGANGRPSALPRADDSRAARRQQADERSKVPNLGRARSDGTRRTMTGAT
jgi:hypothetical protein